jgi:hypothetical protein
MSASAPAAADPPPTAAHLPDDVATLQRMVLELVASLHERQRDNEALRHRLDLLLRRLYGPRGERFDPNQPLLFADITTGQETAAAAPSELAAPEPKRRCRPHGRRRMPENLPREPRHHELSQAERVCQGCGQVRIDIGTDRSEQLDYRPASLIVIENFVHKYVCPCCSKQRAQAAGQQRPPDREPGAMPSRGPEPQPPPEPTPGSGPGDTKPESVSPGPPANRPRAGVSRPRRRRLRAKCWTPAPW